MNQKNSIKNINPNTFPFTEKQLAKLREELDAAGGFDELMLEKKAFRLEMGTEFIPQYHDIKWYKEKFLTGVYESLREFYDTEMPYVFWCTFYEILRRVENKNE